MRFIVLLKVICNLFPKRFKEIDFGIFLVFEEIKKIIENFFLIFFLSF